ncbi:MAG: efflux RND transporter periplasmic adaptor subunit [Akkermansiaceae bacterium]
MKETNDSYTGADQKTDNTVLMVLLTIGLLVGGFFAFGALMGSKPEAKKAVAEVWTPSVKVEPLVEKDYTPVIEAEGEVEAATTTMLISEVAGAVVYISPKLEKGNTISEGEIILRVDDADYKTQLTSAKSTLADAELMLAQERARAVQAERDWKKLGRGGEASELVLRIPQIKSARAKIDAAEAAIAKGERDMAKTVIKAPYRCLVDGKFIDTGAYVSMMSQIAEVSSVAEYEVRLPLGLNEVGFLDEKSGIGSEVLLESTIGGEVYQWKGTAVRFEGGVDSSTFSRIMVVSVKPDLGQENEGFQLPPVGLFVKARVPGKAMGKVFSIPREALREGDSVWKLGESQKLEMVAVEVIRSERDEVIIEARDDVKLTSGDRIILSPIAIPVNGMKLEVEEAAEDELAKPSETLK